jgi:hypothetical protein
LVGCGVGEKERSQDWVQGLWSEQLERWNCH